MGTKADNAIESLMNGLVQYVDDKINAIPYVKTDIGIVKAVNLVNGKYIHTITVRNFDYTGIKSLGNNEFNVDAPVYILVPNGQYNNMFILGYMDDVNASIKGGTIDIGNGKFVVDKYGNMTAIGGGKIGLFSLEDGGFKYYSPESPTDVLGSIEPSGAGGFGGITIGGQSTTLEGSRSVKLICDNDVEIQGAEISIKTEDSEGAVGMGNIYINGLVTIDETFKILDPSPLANLYFQCAYVQNGTAYTYSKIPMLAPSYQQSSDRRLKKEIEELKQDKCVKFINSLKPCEYRYIEDDKVKHHGFIAQEVKENMYDEWDLHSGEERQFLAYTELIADMVSTIQYQQKQIENMKKEITKMKKDITKLGKEE